jgi:membrane-associated phospholipid phosphatase
MKAGSRSRYEFMTLTVLALASTLVFWLTNLDQYAFFALYFLVNQYKVLYLILTLGIAWTLGFTRMTSGGHYLSDILWSGYLVFLVAFALYYGWYRRFAPVVLAAEPVATHSFK